MYEVGDVIDHEIVAWSTMMNIKLEEEKSMHGDKTEAYEKLWYEFSSRLEECDLSKLEWDGPKMLIDEYFEQGYRLTKFIGLSFFLEKDGEKRIYDFGKMSEPLDDCIIPEKAGWIRVKIGGEWGYLDKDMRLTTDRRNARDYYRKSELVNRRYSCKLTRDCIDMFSDVERGIISRYGGIDAHDFGAFCKLSSIIEEDNSAFTYMQNGKYGLRDSLGDIVYEPIFDEIALLEGDMNFSEFYVARMGEKWCLINQKYRGLEELTWFDEKPEGIDWVMTVKRNGKYGVFLPNDNAMVSEFIYDGVEIWGFNEPELFVVSKKDGKYGLIMKDLTVPPIYDKVDTGIALSFIRFTKDGKTGYLDKELNWTEDIANAYLMYWSGGYELDKNYFEASEEESEGQVH